MTNDLAVAEAIEALRAELVDVVRNGSDDEIRFQLDSLQLTLQVTATRNADGTIGWWVLKAGGGYEATTTQTLTLQLTPLRKDPAGNYVKDFTIASPTDPGDTFGRTAG